MNEVVETIYQWHKGMKIQNISRSLGLDRKTVRKYVRIAGTLGISQGGPTPDEQELVGKLKGLLGAQACSFETPALDLITRHRDEIEKLLDDKEMTGKQVWRLLRENHGIRVGYSTIKRYLRSEFAFGRTKATVRMETPPGEEAQVDFGYAGLMNDPETKKRRKTWAFIMTLSSSRHKFVRFVFHQDIDMWIDCHERAFAFFGGVPKRIILDNLKSGVLKADIYDPTINRAYADMERFFGFVADPAKMGMAQHKGKVERAVPVVRKHLLAGRTFADINEANERALRWCKEEIGMEVHGTTKKKPYPTFVTEEKQHLDIAARGPLRAAPVEGVHRPPRPPHRLRQVLLLPADEVYRKKGMGEGDAEDHRDLLGPGAHQGPPPFPYPWTMGDGPDGLSAGEARLPHGDAHVVQEEGSRVRSPHRGARHRHPQRGRHEEPEKGPGASCVLPRSTREISRGWQKGR